MIFQSHKALIGKANLSETIRILKVRDKIIKIFKKFEFEFVNLIFFKKGFLIKKF